MLVANECLQIEGVNFGETFASVVKFNTIRCKLALGPAMDLGMHQMDIKMAFLNNNLEVEIYIEQEERFVDKG